MSVLAAIVLAGSVVTAQTPVDLPTLERKVQDAQAAYARVQPGGDATELREIEDDLAYLRVKQRRGESISSRERQNLSERVDRFMLKIQDDRTSRNTAGSGSQRGPRDSRYGTGQARGGRELPAGSEVDVRLITRLDSDEAQVEDRVEATTMVDLYQDDVLLVPAGSLLTGYVSSVDRAGRTDRKGSLTVAFNQVTVRGRNYPMRGTVVDTIESSGIRGEAARIGAGSAVGAIIGGIIGGVKGALIGVLVGGGGTMVATEGKDVHLPPGTILRVRLDTPPEIR
jgi:hypothetical protein